MTNFSDIINEVESKNYKTTAEKFCGFMDAMKSQVINDDHQKMEEFLKSLGFEKSTHCGWLVSYKITMEGIFDTFQKFDFNDPWFWNDGDWIGKEEFSSDSEIYIYTEPDECNPRSGEWIVDIRYGIDD